MDTVVSDCEVGLRLVQNHDVSKLSIKRPTRHNYVCAEMAWLIFLKVCSRQPQLDWCAKLNCVIWASGNKDTEPWVGSNTVYTN